MLSGSSSSMMGMSGGMSGSSGMSGMSGMGGMGSMGGMSSSHNFWQARQMSAGGVPHMGYTSGHGHQQHDAKMAEKIVTELQVSNLTWLNCTQTTMMTSLSDCKV
jgi:hypothetical protein